MTHIIVGFCVLYNLCLGDEDNGEDFYNEYPAAEENNLIQNDNERDIIVDEDLEDRRILLFREMYPI